MGKNNLTVPKGLSKHLQETCKPFTQETDTILTFTTRDPPVDLKDVTSSIVIDKN